MVAHPGHELRLSAWISRARPLLFILAKGSRSRHSSVRIEASRALAQELGAQPAEPFGATFDSDFYQQILDGDLPAFGRLADSLREAFVRQGVFQVITDAWQNYNPMHDLTHLIARVAAAEAAQMLERSVECLDYPVVLGEMAHADLGSEVMRLNLAPDEVAEKMALAASYPDIAEDAAALSRAAGRRVYDTESLHQTLPLSRLIPTREPPWYERYGEGRVGAGVYSRVLRWDHMAPIVEGLSARLTRALAPSPA